MEILQLKYFMHTAHTENISHTAHQFMVPPSGVSAAIKKLETELGFQLFDRTSNTLKLNENGKILLAALERSQAEMKKAAIDMRSLLSQPTVEIKLLILTHRRIVTKLIASFRALHSAVSFNIKHSDGGKNPNYSEFDVIISDRIISSDSFERRFFEREEIALAVNDSNELASLASVSASRMAQQKFICMPKGASMRDLMDGYFSAASIEPSIAIECDDPLYIREYVKMGLGVTFYPRISWGEPQDNDIRLLRIENGLYRESYIYFNKNSGSAAALFADSLELYNYSENS